MSLWHPNTVLVTHAGRRPNYLARTLASLANSNGLSPFPLDNSRNEIEGAIKDNNAAPTHVHVLVQGLPTFSPKRNKKDPSKHDMFRQQRGATNYAAAMNCPVLSQKKDPGPFHGRLIVEDDVEFAKNWSAKLYKAIYAASLRVANPSLFVLALYHPYQEIQFPPESTPVIDYPGWFGGTQAVFYTPRALQMIYPLVLEAARNYRGGDDIWDKVIGAACALHEIPILACNPTLAQHIGLKSSIGAPFHNNSKHLADKTH